MKTINRKNAFLFAILLSLWCASSLFAQNSGEIGTESDSENKLIKTVLYKGVSEIEKVLSEGVDINQQDKDGYTALIWACSYSSRDTYRESARLLISKGADVNIQAKDGNAAIIEAAGNSSEIFDLLLDSGADMNVKKEDGTGAYYNCMVHLLLYGREITENDLELVRLLLANGANVDEAPVSGELQGYTPLIFAVRENNLEIVKLLIENNTNVNIKNIDGDTPLLLAEKRGDDNMLEILIANGAK